MQWRQTWSIEIDFGQVAHQAPCQRLNVHPTRRNDADVIRGNPIPYGVRDELRDLLGKILHVNRLIGERDDTAILRPTGTGFYACYTRPKEAIEVNYSLGRTVVTV